MKKSLKKFVFLSSLAAATTLTVTACNPAEVVIHIDFSFNVTTKRKNAVYLNQAEVIKIIESKDKSDKTKRNYSYYVVDQEDEQYLTVDQNGTITPKKLTPKKGDKYIVINPSTGTEEEKTYEEDYEVDVEVYELESDLTRYLHLKVIEKFPEADGGYNFSSNVSEKTKILGKLEEYAMSNFLTGISLFENGGYVRYSPRVNLPTQEYISGYGFGLLSEGDLHKSSWLPNVTGDKSYLRSASSSDPLDINAWMATGSQIADLNSYISTSYYGTKIDYDNPGEYKWYPVLAADDCEEPVAIDDLGVEHPDPKGEVEKYKEDHAGEEESETYKLPKSIYKTWRVYVKTGDKIKYHTAEGASASVKSEFNNRAVSIDDYEFVFKLLLTGASGLKRGTELASDTSYGFKGAYSYNLLTARSSSELPNLTVDDYNEFEKAWKNFKNGGGLKTSKDVYGDGYAEYKENGGQDFIQFELVNPFDQFTAKYTLSSNLYSPLPQSFLEKVGGRYSGTSSDDAAQGNWAQGGQLFGKFAGTSIADRVLCLGPYHLDFWTKNQETAFKRSDDWFEHTEQGRYKIPGVHIRIVTAAQTKPDAIYEEFLQEHLDSAGVPASRMSSLPGDAKKTKGDSTFKLNVNACDEDRWNELNKEIWHNTSTYKVKPFMSNQNFLNGLFWSIDRKTFANKHGTEPSFNYFSNSYQSDPNGDTEDPKVYNETQAHEDALKAFGIDVEKEKDPTQATYGYNKSKAINFFRMAVNELTAEGKLKYGSSASNPKVINLNIQWMYPSDKTEYGQDIGNFFMDAFNDPAVCGKRIVLKVNHNADTDWQQVYNDHLMIGKFDLGFGAISGNSLAPLNFMEVLRSDNSSGFTLNWGADTSKFDDAHPIVYNGKEWTYDSLWASADHGSVVSAGEEAKIVSDGYIENTGGISDFRDGGTVTAKFDFVNVQEGATFEITSIQLYLVGAGIYSITSDHIKLLNKAGEVITEETEDKVVAQIQLEFTKAMAEEINNQIFLGNKYQKAIDKLDPKDPDYNKKVDDYHHKFTYANYRSTDGKGMWLIQVFYSVQIAGSEETESEFDLYKSEGDVPKNNRFGFAR